MKYYNNLIYEIRQSAKGWSEPYEFFFSRKTAEHELERLNKWKMANNVKINFKIVSLQAGDCFITDYEIE